MEESKTLVEQLREMVELSTESNQYPTVHADAILGHLCVNKSDERELFTAIADRIENEYMPLPLDADSMPIKTGDNVFFIEEDEPHEVFGFLYENGESLVHIGRRDGTSTDAYVKPEELTHKQPDTIERIEADAKPAAKAAGGAEEGAVMSEELLPCPFCGGEAEVWSHHYEEKDITLWLVRCKERPYEAERACYASDSFISFYTKAEAIEAWNTRAERTCKAEQDYDAMDDGIPDCRIWKCSCGESFPFWRGLNPCFCPNCGAKVVE